MAKVPSSLADPTDCMFLVLLVQGIPPSLPACLWAASHLSQVPVSQLPRTFPPPPGPAPGLTTGPRCPPRSWEHACTELSTLSLAHASASALGPHWVSHAQQVPSLFSPPNGPNVTVDVK